MLFHISLNVFLDMYPQARETKEKKIKRDYIKLKSFCRAKETITKTKRQPITEWEKIFANRMSAIGLISKIKNLQLNTKKTKQCDFKKRPE